MDGSERKKIIVLGLIAAVFAVIILCFPKDVKDETGALHVGSGDDITGVFLQRICTLAEEDGNGLITEYAFADCCGSSAEWALRTGDIDLGFYCSQAALSMINALDEYEIYAPAVLNCEVVAVEQGFDPAGIRMLGVPRGRDFLRSIAAEKYPAAEQFGDISRGLLMFALRSGEADGVVVDVSALTDLDMEADFYPLCDHDYISYCLVVRKDLVGTESFERFLGYLNEAAEDLNRTDRQVELMGMDEDFWDMTGLRFLSIE